MLWLAPGVSWAPAPAAGVEYVSCARWDGWQEAPDVRCGYLNVPEDHDRPDGRRIRIAFAIFAGRPGGDPNLATLFLTGGPGGRALKSARRGANHPMRELGDFIVVEQRGIGLSTPLPDIGVETFALMAADLSAADERARYREAMAAKAAEIAAAGIDASKYNSTQNAKDFGALMAALDYRRYNLYGASYGTKLAITIMKYFEPRIRAAILEGPARLDNRALEARFPDALRALNGLFQRCAAAPECRAGHPDLHAELLRALDALAAEPLAIEVLDAPFVLNPQDFLFFVRYLLYAPDALDTVPRFVTAASARDADTLGTLAARPALILKNHNVSAFLSFNRYEEFSPETPAAVAAFTAGHPEFAHGLAWFQAFIPALESWHGGRASEAESEYRDIAVPALIITNDLDPVTPPRNTALFERGLTEARVLRLDRFGHGASGNCISRIRLSFLRDPKRSLDTTCLERRP